MTIAIARRDFLKSVVLLGVCSSTLFGQSPQTVRVGPTGGPYKVIAADFTGDKVVDLAIGYHAIGLVTVEVGDGKGHFSRAGLVEGAVPQPSVMGGVYNVAQGDIDNDGLLDLVFAVQYWINPGKRIFQDSQLLVRRTVEASQIPGRRSHAINDVRAADVTGDGNLDLVTANLGTSTISIFPGNGDGTFQKDTLLEAGQNGAFLAVGDLNHDGALDIVITHWTEDFLSVFLNHGKGQFGPRTDHKTGLGNYGVTLGDVNGDGKLDAVTANYRERSISVLLGVGDGTFQPAVTTPKGLQLRDGKWVDEKAAR
jgi:VCBS repeat protein